jgi:asparagine synthase (glutamine-hydrolysing)
LLKPVNNSLASLAAFFRLVQDKMLDITPLLYNINLQRADRISMAFGLETCVPFLDIQSLRLALSLPADQKTHQDRPSKHLLREADTSDLSEEIVNRPKQKFSKSTGSSDFIDEIAEREISGEEFHTELTHLSSRWGYRLPNKEALYYYKLPRQHFEVAGYYLRWGKVEVYRHVGL